VDLTAYERDGRFEVVRAGAVAPEVVAELL
jgi:hypothetical protein